MSSLDIPANIAGKPRTIRVESDSQCWKYGLVRVKEDGTEYAPDWKYTATLNGALMRCRDLFLRETDARGADAILEALQRFDGEISPLLSVSARVHLGDG